MPERWNLIFLKLEDKTIKSILIVLLFCVVETSLGATITINNHSGAEALYTAAVTAQRGDTIILEPGRYYLNRELRFGARGLTVRGKNPKSVILDFTNQKQGAQGILVRGWDITLTGFSVLNPVGDGVVIRNSGRILVSNVLVSMGPSGNKNNGGYGLYPVRSRDVTIEDCTVSGATDAGIYLGQSINAKIVNNHAFGNVAGVNVENSFNVNIQNNVFNDNTVGALLISLPDMIYPKSKNILFDGNVLKNNNRTNFARIGNIVSLFASGTGLALVATSTVNVHGNSFAENAHNDVLLANYSYLKRPPHDSRYDPRLSYAFIGKQKDKIRIFWDGVFDTRNDSMPFCLEGLSAYSINTLYDHMNDCRSAPNISIEVERPK